MNLRVKLLLGFWALALSALTFFGFIAYDTAEQASTSKEAALLRGLFANVAEEVSSTLAASGNVNETLKRLGAAHGQHTSIVVRDNAGKVAYSSDNQKSYEHVAAHVSENKEGQLIDENFSYSWVTLPITNSHLTVTIVSELDQGPQLSFLRQMGVSLVFTAFIVLWLAAWGAMYVASLIEKLNEQRNILQYQALHDNLTGLPNRVLLRDRLKQIFLEYPREKQPFSLFFIDLNRFKEINDTLGHHAGDELLAIVAKRISEAVRRSDTVARLGGDEFAVLLRKADQQGAERVAKKIVAAIEEAVTLQGKSCFVSCSIGIATYPGHGDDIEELFRNSDAAMYRAKKTGIRFLFFNPDMDSTVPEKLSLVSELRDAIQKNEITIAYQAKFDIVLGVVTGAEALARWNHPQLGFVPPVEFIDIAEKSGLITPLAYLIIESAFRDHAKLVKDGHTLSIAINLSSFNLHDPNLVGEITRLAAKYQANPRSFVFELTESAVMTNPDQVKAALTALANMGFIISIDDFGTGYSSLVNLRRLPVDEIKIDRSFVFNLFKNEDDAAIVKTTIALGRSLGINVVAEGVETKEMLDVISGFGCHQAQGYFISKPIPFLEFSAWLKQCTPTSSEAVTARASLD